MEGFNKGFQVLFKRFASKEGSQANGKKFRVHLDGYNFLHYFQGKAEEGPRREIMYFAASGMLNAIRVDNWKVAFAIEMGPISEAYRSTPFGIKILLLSKYIS